MPKEGLTDLEAASAAFESTNTAAKPAVPSSLKYVAPPTTLKAGSRPSSSKASGFKSVRLVESNSGTYKQGQNSKTKSKMDANFSREVPVSLVSSAVSRIWQGDPNTSTPINSMRRVCLLMIGASVLHLSLTPFFVLTSLWAALGIFSASCVLDIWLGFAFLIFYLKPHYSKRFFYIISITGLLAIAGSITLFVGFARDFNTCQDLAIRYKQLGDENKAVLTACKTATAAYAVWTVLALTILVIRARGFYFCFQSVKLIAQMEALEAAVPDHPQKKAHEKSSSSQPVVHAHDRKDSEVTGTGEESDSDNSSMTSSSVSATAWSRNAQQKEKGASKRELERAAAKEKAKRFFVDENEEDTVADTTAKRSQGPSSSSSSSSPSVTPDNAASSKMTFSFKSMFNKNKKSSSVEAVNLGDQVSTSSVAEEEAIGAGVGLEGAKDKETRITVPSLEEFQRDKARKNSQVTGPMKGYVVGEDSPAVRKDKAGARKSAVAPTRTSAVFNNLMGEGDGEEEESEEEGGLGTDDLFGAGRKAFRQPLPYGSESDFSGYAHSPMAPPSSSFHHPFSIASPSQSDFPKPPERLSPISSESSTATSAVDRVGSRRLSNRAKLPPLGQENMYPPSVTSSSHPPPSHSLPSKEWSPSSNDSESDEEDLTSMFKYRSIARRPSDASKAPVAPPGPSPHAHQPPAGVPASFFPSSSQPTSSLPSSFFPTAAHSAYPPQHRPVSPGPSPDSYSRDYSQSVSPGPFGNPAPYSSPPPLPFIPPQLPLPPLGSSPPHHSQNAWDPQTRIPPPSRPPGPPPPSGPPPPFPQRNFHNSLPPPSFASLHSGPNQPYPAFPSAAESLTSPISIPSPTTPSHWGT